MGLCPERAGDAGVCAGQVGDSKGASLGCHLNIGYRAPFGTIRHYMTLLGLNC